MRDLENRYLEFIRDQSEFVCIRKLFFKIVFKTSNDYLRTKKLCTLCVKNINTDREPFHFIDIKGVIYKRKHMLMTQFGSTNYSFNNYTCENCSMIIKDYANSESCTECARLIANSDFMKNNINSVVNFPTELTYDYFIKNCDVLENLFLSRIHAQYSRYTIIHKQIMTWNERHLFIHKENEQIQFENKHEFNSLQNLSIEAAVYDEEFREEQIQKAIKKTIKNENL